MRFRADIEGLRAVAILPVILYHANSAIAPAGFIGVDIFFVISGFLITRLILDAMAQERFSVAGFYARRVRRIFPALFAMLAVTAPVACAILSPHALVEFGRTVAATALFVSNIQFYRLSDYFGGAAAFKPLLHTWSLAVEEQFYIIFPLLLMGMRGWRRGYRVFALAALAALSVAASAWAAAHDPRLGFFLGPFRAFELLTGALLSAAALPCPGNRLIREFLSLAGLTAIGCAIVFMGADTPFPGVAALVPCLGAAAIIHTGCGDRMTLVERGLSSSSVRLIGAMSYSLYLWHWPALAMARNFALGDLGMSATALVLAGVFFVSWLSWRFLEQPIQNCEWPRRLVFGAGAAAITTSCLVGALLFQTSGWPQRFTPQARQMFAYAADFSPERDRCHDGETIAVSYQQSCLFGPAAGPITAVWADSHGAELSFALGREGVRTMELTSTSCPPALDFDPAGMPGCTAHNKNILAGLTADPRVKTVILAAHYSAYAGAAVWPIFQRGLERSVAALQAAGRHVVLVDPLPEFRFPVPEAVGLLRARSPSADFSQPLEHYRAQNARALAEIASLAAQPGIRRIDSAALYCADGSCKTLQSGKVLYFDDNHLSLAGARILAQAIKSKP